MAPEASLFSWCLKITRLGFINFFSYQLWHISEELGRAVSLTLWHLNMSSLESNPTLFKKKKKKKKKKDFLSVVIFLHGITKNDTLSESPFIVLYLQMINDLRKKWLFELPARSGFDKQGCSASTSWIISISIWSPEK